MSKDKPGHALRHARRMIEEIAQTPDGDLVERFVYARDELAFESLVQRYGPMVLGVCRRLLSSPHDVDDAFQATFLVFVRKAGSIKKGEAVGSWLYRVAYHTAVKARAARNRHRSTSLSCDDLPATSNSDPGQELRPILDAAVNQLPEKYRQPIVLCYLQGKTNEQAAQELGCPVGTIWTRLNRGRERLRGLLERRGLVVPTAGLAAALAESAASASVPAALFDQTLRSSMAFAAGAGAVDAPAGIAEQILREMVIRKLRMPAVLLAGLLVLAGSAWVTVHSLSPLSVEPAVPVNLDRDFGQLHGLLKPQTGESRWREIDWLTNFWKARQIAAAEGKPILLNLAGKGYPFSPCQPTVRQGRSPSFWTEANTRLVKDRFVAVAADGRVLMSRQDAEGRFLRDDCGLKVNPESYRMLCLSAGGRLLGHEPQAAWSTFNKLPEGERLPGAVKVEALDDVDRNALPEEPPPGGMILKIYARLLTRMPDGQVRLARPEDFTIHPKHPADLAEMVEASPDHLWLKADEWRSLVPSDVRPGNCLVVPAAITRRLLLYHLMPRRVYAVGAPWEPGDVRAGRLTLTVGSSTASTLELRLDGIAHLGATYDPALPVEQHKMGYEARVSGMLTYDRKREIFTRCDILVLGDVYGKLPVFDGSAAAATRPGRNPLGFAIELVSGVQPIDRLPPTGRTWRNYFQAAN